ncbi:hypothetical protein RNAN_0292 [Rheinheimera nanhaiensis E407-8]|uniref:DUF3545 domain-containing protein n=2 Tax=Chromatiaceae TaxID=1046 RepID=I1DTF1_9GAMM|nr:hypothetical protein RNAN_0292 [Rheinheimera nanhaiensis E407-8]
MFYFQTKCGKPFVENNNNNTQRGIIMESFEDLLNMLERPAAKPRAAKRKWREIEQLKERQRLKKELSDIDWTIEPELADIEL